MNRSALLRHLGDGGFGRLAVMSVEGVVVARSGFLDSPVWAGVTPLATRALEPMPAPNLKAGIELPGYIRDYPNRR